MTATFLRLRSYVGVDPNGQLGKLDAAGLSWISVLPSASPIAGEESRVIPGTRIIETGSSKVVEALSENTQRLESIGSLAATDYGVLSAGGGDQTAQISAFFDFCHTQGKNAYFPKGVYESGQIVKKYGLNVAAEPGTEITVKAGTAGELWTFEGSKGTSTHLEAEALAGARQIKVASTAGMSKGSVVKLETVTAVPNGAGAKRKCGQEVEVAEVVNGTEVKLRERLYRTFTAFAGADATVVTILNVIKGMEVAGLKFVNPAEANCRFLLVQIARDVDINIESDGQLQPAIELQDVYGYRVTSRSEHGQHDNVTKFGYAVCASAGSCHGEVDSVCSNGNFAFTNTGVDEVPGEPYDATITGICDNSSKSGVFFHPEGHDFTVTGMQILNPAENGVEVGCPRVVVQNNTITGCKENGVRVATGGLSKIRIVGNTITECEARAVYLNCTATMEDITVAENTFDTITKMCVLASCKLLRYRQHGNTYRNYGTGASEGYAWRFIEELKSGAIYDESVDAAGANQKISRFEVKAESCVVARCIIKHANSVAKWALDSGGEAATNGAEQGTGGVLYEANLVQTT